MKAFIFRKLLNIVPTILLLSIIIFIGMELTPGDAATALIEPDTPIEDIEKIREALGLNEPAHVRYFLWITGIFKGDFGISLNDGSDIATVIYQKLGATLELMFTSFFFSSIIGIFLGIISSLNKYSKTDHFLTMFGMIGLSVPSFFFGIISLKILSVDLQLLPFGGRLSPDEMGYSRILNLIQPALVLALLEIAAVMRYSRSTMIDVLGKDYIVTARSKGLAPWKINFLHGFRTAVTPIIVLLAFRLPGLIGGSIIIETVFVWPGMGSTFIYAVEGRDYNMVMMISLIVSVIVLVASLLVDVLIAAFDPRVKLE
tara:strand:- start:58 stop:1002 length:945 start_codon:yes stop_codon:yes gene_type:complete